MTVMLYPGYSQTIVRDNLLVRTIASITSAFPAVLTTTLDHGYVIGMNVTFLIPVQFGMTGLNGKNVQVIDLTSNTLTLNVDTTEMAAFAYPSPLPNAFTPPSVIPNSSGAYLPPQPLPYGNQTSLEGTIYNGGLP